MSYENVERVDGKIFSIIKGFGNGTALELLKEAPTINKTYQTFESLLKTDTVPSSPLIYFMNNTLKTLVYQIYAHPIMVATILSQCKVGEFSKKGLLESLKEIKNEKGMKGLYTSIIPSLLSMMVSHLSDTALTFSLLRIFDSSLQLIKSTFMDYASNMNGEKEDIDEGNMIQEMGDNEQLKAKKENIEKIKKLMTWILVLILSPLLKFLIKNPLEVITCNSITDSFSEKNKNKNIKFLFGFLYTISRIYKTKGIRGFYSGAFSSTWSSFFSSLFMIVPFPYLGVSSNSKSILNFLVQQLLHFSFHTTKLRMSTHSSIASSSHDGSLSSTLSLTSGAFSSFNEIRRGEGFSGLFSGFSKYLFLSPVVAAQYYFNSKNKNNPTNNDVNNNANNENNIDILGLLQNQQK